MGREAARQLIARSFRAECIPARPKAAIKDDLLDSAAPGGRSESDREQEYDSVREKAETEGRPCAIDVRRGSHWRQPAERCCKPGRSLRDPSLKWRASRRALPRNRGVLKTNLLETAAVELGAIGLRVAGSTWVRLFSSRNPPLKPLPEPVPMRIEFPTNWATVQLQLAAKRSPLPSSGIPSAL